jgi:hypothetical protein
MADITYPKLSKVKSPQWRLAKATVVSEDSEDCPYIAKLKLLLAGEVQEDYIQEAYQLFAIPSSRAIIDAVLVGEPELRTLAVALGTTELCLDFYAKCFFDTSVFSNKLILREFILSRPENTTWEREYKNLLKSSFTLGYKYILWRNSLDGIEGLYDAKEMSSTMMRDSYWRSREHVPFSISSDVAKESKSWIPQALRAIDKKLETDNSTTGAHELLRLKLVKDDITVSRESFPHDLKG